MTSRTLARPGVLEPTAVNVHDFPGEALGRAVPYGVYDLTTNRGLVYVGNSGDMPALAADAIAAGSPVWRLPGCAIATERSSVIDKPIHVVR